MGRILVKPEALESAGAQMQRASADVRTLADRMLFALQGMEWQVGERAVVERQATVARQNALALADQLSAMSTLLAQTALQFREADAAGVEEVAAAAPRWSTVFPPGAMRDAQLAGAAVPATIGLGWMVKQNPELFPPVAPPTLAPGVTNTDAWVPVSPPVTNGPGARSQGAYSQVIGQFAVTENPRYAPRGGNTYCNIYVWDVSAAMGAEIPHWVDGDGNPVGVGKGRELNANGVYDWLSTHSERHGWREVGAEEAQAMANQGQPSVAAWHSGSGKPGHVAMVRPGEYAEAQGPAIAQAGGTNYSETTAAVGFGRERMAQVRYWVHA